MSTTSTGNTSTREILNVSPGKIGSTSTDMINGSQTYTQLSTVTAVTSLSTVSPSLFIAGTTVVVNGDTTTTTTRLLDGSLIVAVSIGDITTSTTTNLGGQVIEIKTIDMKTGWVSGQTITYVNGIASSSLWASTTQGAALAESLHVSFSNVGNPTFSTSAYLAPGVASLSTAVPVTSPLTELTIDYAKKITATSANDSVVGNISVELIEGGKGNDTLYGGGNTSTSSTDMFGGGLERYFCF